MSNARVFHANAALGCADLNAKDVTMTEDKMHAARAAQTQDGATMALPPALFRAHAFRQTIEHRAAKIKAEPASPYALELWLTTAAEIDALEVPQQQKNTLYGRLFDLVSAEGMDAVMATLDQLLDQRRAEEAGDICDPR